MQVQKRADRSDLEAKLTGMPYKRKPTNIRLAVQAPMAFSSRWRGQQADLLVIANGWNLDARLAGHLSDRYALKHALAPQVAREFKVTA